jgi:hypothetical protein
MARTTMLALALSALLWAPVEAAAKTSVLVKFVLQAYTQHFDAAQTDEVQKQATELIAARLDEHVPFLEFAGQGDGPFTLTATLRRRLPSERTAAPGEVVLEFKLDGGGLTGREFVVFRPANNIDPIPRVDGLVKEIDLRLTEETYRVQLRSLLLKVPVAATGEVVSVPQPGWALPYQRNELCLDSRSQLEVDHVVQLSGGVLRPRLKASAEGDDVQGRIVGLPTNPAEFQQRIAALPPGQVTVGPIWVIVYEDLQNCSKDFPR